MSLATLKTDLAALKAAVISRSPSPICRACLGAVSIDAADVIDLFSPTDGPVMFGADPDKAECKSLCDDIKNCCEKELAHPVANAGPVGKLFPGDGSFLKAIIAMILALAPLFVEPAPSP